MRQRDLIIHILDYDTGKHVDSVVFNGAFIEDAVMMAQNLIKKTWAALTKKSTKELKQISNYLVREFPMTFQAVKKDTEYLAYCSVLVDSKLCPQLDASG